jgi:hypothetical protein
LRISKQINSDTPAKQSENKMLTKVFLSGLYVKFGNVNRKKKILKIDTRNPLDSMFRKKEYGDIFWNDKE